MRRASNLCFDMNKGISATKTADKPLNREFSPPYAPRTYFLQKKHPPTKVFIRGLHLLENTLKANSHNK